MDAQQCPEKNHWFEVGNFCPIFEVFFTLTAWLQCLTLKPNCIKTLWNFEPTHRSGFVLIMKWENFYANGFGCPNSTDEEMKKNDK